MHGIFRSQKTKQKYTNFLKSMQKSVEVYCKFFIKFPKFQTYKIAKIKSSIFTNSKYKFFPLCTKRL